MKPAIVIAASRRGVPLANAVDGMRHPVERAGVEQAPRPAHARNSRPHDAARRAVPRQGGGAAVEFAILLPLLVFLLVAFIDLGILLVDDIILTNAARQGARWGTISTNSTWTTATCSGTYTTTTDSCGVANTFAHGALITLGGSSLPSTSASGSGAAGGTVSVTTSYTPAVLGFNFAGLLLGKTRTLTATVRMSHE